MEETAITNKTQLVRNFLKTLYIYISYYGTICQYLKSVLTPFIYNNKCSNEQPELCPNKVVGPRGSNRGTAADTE